MQSKSFAVTWLDIRNAFGSIETVSMLQILTFFKAPKYISGVIRNIYEGGEFLVQGGDGVHASIPVTKGVRQGCPLSGVLFNLVMEPLLRGLMKSRTDGFRSAWTDNAKLVQGVHNIKSSDGLSFGVFSVSDGITDNIL